MKRHVLHPLWLALGLVVTILVARQFLVPEDFGVNGRNFTYGFHRLSNIQEWKDFPVKYQGRESCADCHEENYRLNRRSPHKRVQCENCHGPSRGHPDEIAMLPVDTDRSLCLRCHANLDYPNTARADMPNVDDRTHHRRHACADCHNPHDPRERVE
jgi:Cytochrome c3